MGCDLLENSYLCGISNNISVKYVLHAGVVICLKIRTFVVSATTPIHLKPIHKGCDLLENSYLCGISNNRIRRIRTVFRLWFAWKFVPLWYQQQRLKLRSDEISVVICLKIRTFVVSATTLLKGVSRGRRCDLLENSYLCGISNNPTPALIRLPTVVICLKIRTFVVSATT